MLNQHGNGKTVHKHSSQVGCNIYVSGLDFLVIVEVLIKTFSASVKLHNRLSGWNRWQLVVSMYQWHICCSCANKHTAINKWNSSFVSLLTCGSFSGSETEVGWGYDLLTNTCRPVSEKAKWDQVPAKNLSITLHTIASLLHNNQADCC